MKKKLCKVFGKVFVRPSTLHIQREKFSFVMKRSVVISVIILALGCGLTLISTATTYFSQCVAGIIK